jgi:hypothetical protein
MGISDITKSFFKSKIANDDLEPIKQPSDQTMEEKQLVGYVKSKIDLVRQTNSRIAQEGIYLCNVAYLLGFDGVYFDTTYRQFKNIDPKRKISRNRFKINKILPTIQNRLARITQSPPRYDVRPNSNSTGDKDASRLGMQVLDNVLQRQRFNEKRQDAHMNAMQGGSAYLQAMWDPTLGEPMYDPETNEFQGYEGDIRIEVLNALEIFRDPLAKTLDEAAWIIKVRVRKLDYFKAKWPERGNAVKEEDTWLLSTTYDMKSNSLTSVGIVGAQTQDQMKNAAIELVYYEKRSEDHPRGRMIVTASGILLEDKELPIGEYDIFKIDDIVIGGRYDSEAIITHLRPIQDQYNISRTKMADWVRKLLAGKYMAPKGSGLGQEAINNDNGEVVEYNMVPGASEPKAMVIPQMPPYAYKEIETLDHEFDFVSGINEISRGVLPSASIPAQGMAFLQEQDQTRIGVTTTRNEIAYAKLGSAILKYAHEYYKLPRTLKIAGEGLEYCVKDFMGDDLKENFDVIVIEGSTIPQSKVLRRQDILNSYQMGLLGPVGDPKVLSKVCKWTEFGDSNEMWKKQSLDEAQVKRVIEAIEKEDDKVLQQNMSEFDNQACHLEMMNEYRISDKFNTLSDQQKQKFIWVMEWRIQAGIQTLNPSIAQGQNMAEHAVQTSKMQGHQLMSQMPVTSQGGQQAPPIEQQPVPNANHLPPIHR